MDITLPDIVANLTLPIDHKKISRFNISRANVWDGAVRGFKCTTYSETCDMLVKFTDDTGVLEEGIGTGGPRREFLPLLMKRLKDQPIFDGPEGHRFLVYNANAVREDEYYLAGKMIAVSVVHGGQGPHFLSEDLVHYLAGQPSFKATNNLITDEEIGKALQVIENAASLDALQECMMRQQVIFFFEMPHGPHLWFMQACISVINLFRDGLSTLEFLNAQQHPTLLAPVLCHSERRLTAFELESLFKPDLSPSGKGQAAVSVEDVLMFATGLSSLPPSGLEPLPQIEFLNDSAFPMANTCSNSLRLPLLDVTQNTLGPDPVRFSPAGDLPVGPLPSAALVPDACLLTGRFRSESIGPDAAAVNLPSLPQSTRNRAVTNVHCTPELARFNLAML
ncbi:unnamed protein product [Leuciscus chuanchicus]